MPLMHWSPNLTVGVDFMDEDHQKLMNLVNELAAQIQTHHRDDIISSFDDLLEATRDHFAAEEEAMEEAGYPVSDHHKQLHEALVEELVEFRDRYRAPGEQPGDELPKFMKDWLIGHILESDKHLGGYLMGRASVA